MKPWEAHQEMVFSLENS